VKSCGLDALIALLCSLVHGAVTFTRVDLSLRNQDVQSIWGELVIGAPRVCWTRNSVANARVEAHTSYSFEVRASKLLDSPHSRPGKFRSSCCGSRSLAPAFEHHSNLTTIYIKTHELLNHRRRAFQHHLGMR